LGLNIHEIEFIAEAPAAAAEAGTRSVRLVAWWKWMEPAQGFIDFSQLDLRVAEAAGRGLAILVVFTSIPTWANGSAPDCDFWSGECSAPPSNPDFFGDFAGAVAARYASAVDSWEIWNEPDYHAFWTGSASEWMTTIVTPGVAAIRAADPEAYVIGPGTYASISTFVTFASLACTHLDALSAHFYKPTVAQMFLEIDTSFESWITAHCDRDLWVTETGVDSTLAGETTQATEYVAAYQGSVARERLARVFLFQWADGDPTVGGRSWGLVERAARGHRPKRSFWAVQDYALALSGQPNRTVLRDSFANDTAGRTIGSPVSGTTSEVGLVAWVADASLVFGSSELTTLTGGDASHVGGLAFGPGSGSGDVHLVEADLLLDGVEWVAVGFSTSASGGYWTDGQVWAHLGPDGTWAAYADGLQHLLAAGSAAVVDPPRLNSLGVLYDSASNSLRVLVNGLEVMPEYLLGGLGFAPGLAYAGIQVKTASGSPGGRVGVDNFRVLSTPTSDNIFADGFEAGDLSAWSSSS